MEGERLIVPERLDMRSILFAALLVSGGGTSVSQADEPRVSLSEVARPWFSVGVGVDVDVEGGV